jgi:hypothetical protein
MGIVNGMPLGGPGELWRVVPKHPANDWVIESGKAAGGDYGEFDVAYYTSRTLLLDVLHAAGAIEYTVQRIDATSAAVQAYAERHEVRADSEELPMGLVTGQVAEAYIEYANLLNWLRTLIDRIRSTDPFSEAKLGLIPALNPEVPLRREVETIFDRLVRDPVIADESALTNFGLHLHALPGGGSPRAMVDSGGLARLLIPDKPTDRVYVFDQFSYHDQRELVWFAHEVFHRVEEFVGDLLSVFERGTADAMSQREQQSSSSE